MVNKKGQENPGFSYLVYALIALGIVVVVGIIYFLLSGKVDVWIEFFKNMARGR